MSKKHWIYVKRGLSQDPKHRETMGMRVWLYMHILDRADWETGIVYDWRDKDEAADMDMPWRTLQGQRQELEELGYIRCEKKENGQDIVIHNWTNPRDYSGEVANAKGKGLRKSTYPGTDQSTDQSTETSRSKVRTLHTDQESLNHRSVKGADAPDLRKDTPQIIAWREATKRYPSKLNWDYIISHLPESVDIAKLRETIAMWNAKGWKPDNVEGQIDCYLHGFNGKNGNGKNGKPHAASVASPPTPKRSDLTYEEQKERLAFKAQPGYKPSMDADYWAERGFNPDGMRK